MLAKTPTPALTETRDLHHKAVGWLVPQMVRCGKPGCRCARGELHGPYYVRGWWERGEQRRRYVPLANVEAVRRELAEAAEKRERLLAAWEYFRRLRKLLREVD